MRLLSQPRTSIPLFAIVFTVAALLWIAVRSQIPAGKAASLRPESFSSDPLIIRLATAVDRGDQDGIHEAVRAGADVNARGSGGCSLLCWAMKRNRVEGFEALLDNGADPTLECHIHERLTSHDSSRRPIRLSLTDTNPKFLDALLRHGYDADFVLDQSSGETLLFGAVYDHSEWAMHRLLEAGADINYQGHSGYTPLVSAAQIRDYKAAWFLMRHGASPTNANDEKKSLVATLKTYGSRGVRPGQEPYFEAIVTELVARGLLTRQDIVEADKPKPSVTGRAPGITVIEHTPQSEAGQALRKLDAAEREANQRTGR